MSNSVRPHGLQPTSLLRPWDFPIKSTGVGYILTFLKDIHTNMTNFLHPVCQFPIDLSYRQRKTLGVPQKKIWKCWHQEEDKNGAINI